VARGVRISLGTDAHDPADLSWMGYGLGLCRRGWATPDLVLNTLSSRDLLEWAS